MECFFLSSDLKCDIVASSGGGVNSDLNMGGEYTADSWQYTVDSKT